ncbi:MAG TPA: M20/M25/M40 family metallo-hydrolase, partial [Pirellulales bacterium]
LEGTGPKRDQAIVIGAHYDHLGHGEPGSADPGSKEIHNGADDNASGVAVLIEVARRLSERSQKLPRTVVFLAFTGEERGLLGSANYVRHPLVPLDKTIAMINMDMVGRLTDEKLIIYGTDTAKEFEPLVERLGKPLKFDIATKHGGFGPSDHSSFYAREIPVMHFFTGSHPDYHRPTDDFPKLNVDGMRRVGLLVSDVAVALADAADPPHFQESQEKPAGGDGGDRPYFGSVPDFSSGDTGYALAGVTKGSPADKAGIKAKDVIIRFGDSKIGGLEDFDSALRKFKAGDKVPVVVRRGKEEVKLDVTLDPPR